MAYAIVYRFEGYKPEQLMALQKHHARQAGDLEHCDPERFGENIVTYGNRDSWAEEFLAEVEAYKELNMRNECAALNARGRATEAKRRRVKGGQDPWKKSSELGVVRGILLTANADFFKQVGFDGFDGADFRDPVKCQQFMALGNAWIEAKIPREYWLFGTWEFDEHGLHFHGYYRTWNTKETKTKGVQRMLQPTDMVHFRNAELAQTQVAEHFAPMGLVRGKETAKERREAKAEGRMPPKKAKHVKPHIWRRQERAKLLEAKRKATAAAEIEEKKQKEAAAARDAARREREELSRAMIDAEKRREREEREHLARLRRVEEKAAERRARDDAARAAQQSEEDKQRAEREATVAARETEIERKTGLLVRALHEFDALGDSVKEAARKVGLVDHPLVQTAGRAVERMREMLGTIGGKKLGGDQRERQRTRTGS